MSELVDYSKAPHLRISSNIHYNLFKCKYKTCCNFISSNSGCNRSSCIIHYAPKPSKRLREYIISEEKERQRQSLRRFAKKITKVPETVRRYT